MLVLVEGKEMMMNSVVNLVYCWPGNFICSKWAAFVGYL